MVWMGVQHIVTGYDHLAFLLGLLLLGGRVRTLVAILTAFTVAHSITLALAVLRVVSLSPGFVEPAIALSIAYVGVENLFVTDARKRWRITFPFGLLHGFGFAGALTALDLPRAQLPSALFGFNLGSKWASCRPRRRAPGGDARAPERLVSRARGEGAQRGHRARRVRVVRQTRVPMSETFVPLPYGMV